MEKSHDADFFLLSFRYLSERESVWHRKLTAENLATDSPRLLKKAEGLQASFPVGCLSKRIYLMRQRIRQNLRSGSFPIVSEANFRELSSCKMLVMIYLGILKGYMVNKLF